MTTECIVHHRKYLSKFHGTINQLRQLNEFNLSVLQQLPKRCCSCHDLNGESSFTIDHLRELCQQIQVSQKPTAVISSPVKLIQYVILEFPQILTPLQRIYKAGRFIGRNGQHVRLLQNKLNVRIDILNKKSKKNFRQIAEKIQVQHKEDRANDLWVFVTMKNDNDDLEKVKQSIENTWKQIDVTTRKSRSTKIRSSAGIIAQSIDISEDGDTRWKPKKQKQKAKYKNKQNQSDEQEQIEPQPLAQPISMPKELTKYQKNKQK